MSNRRLRGYGRRAQRGFVHLLLLVFAVLGLTMWGASELTQWTREREVVVENKVSANLQGAKDALVRYALVPPAPLYSAGNDDSYNFYDWPINDGRVEDPLAERDLSEDWLFKIRFRYFSLPCPDVWFDGGAYTSVYGGVTSAGAFPEEQGRLDGVADRDCGEALSSGMSPDILASHSRFGRLPWRTSRVHGDDEGAMERAPQYRRGLDNVDFRDGYDEHLWYWVSGNLADDYVDNLLGQAPARNLHLLQREREGWLTAVDDGGVVLSDRVAAFVIGPGQRGEENGLYPRALQSDLENDSSGATVNFRAYLEESTYGSYLAGGNRVTIRNSQEAYVDRVAYLTIDELAQKSEDLMEEAPVNIYDRLEGEGRFTGASELLEDYLNKNGFLPAPAMFDENAVRRTHRPSGAPAYLSITVQVVEDTFGVSVVVNTMTSSVTVAGVVTTTTMTVTMYNPYTLQVESMAEVAVQQGAVMNSPVERRIGVRVSDLPRVFLGEGALLVAHAAGGYISPPFGVGLARLDSSLNTVSLYDTRVEYLERRNLYPTVGVAGLNNTLVSVTWPSAPSTPFEINPTVDPVLRLGNDIVVVFADSGYGYFVDEDSLTDVISYAGGVGGDAIAAIPPHAARAYLPVGTQVKLRSDDVLVRLPSDFSLPRGSTYDPDTGSWSIGGGGTDVPVEIVAVHDQVAFVDSMPNGMPAVAGDMGMLPLSDTRVEQPDRSGAFYARNLRGSRFVELQGRTYSHSPLEKEVAFVNASDPLLLVQFETAGKLNDMTWVGGGRADDAVQPYEIAPNSRFVAPAGSQLFYPAGAVISLRAHFAPPDGAILRFPRGAVVSVTARAWDSPRSPSGREIPSGSYLVTLAHGGYVRMRGVKPELAIDGSGLGTNLEALEMHFLGDGAVTVTNATRVNYTAGVVGGVAAFYPAVMTGITATFGLRNETAAVGEGGLVNIHKGAIVRPVEDVLLYGSDTGIMRFNGILGSDAYVRAGFGKRARSAMYYVDEPLSPQYGEPIRVPSPAATPMGIAVEGVYGTGQTGPLMDDAGGVVTHVTVAFDEDSWFYLPPRKPISMGAVTVLNRNGVDVTLAQFFVLPISTAIFDADARPLMTNLEVDTPGGRKIPKLIVTKDPVTVRLVHAALVSIVLSASFGGTVLMTTVRKPVPFADYFFLYPESDMYYLEGTMTAMEREGMKGGTIFDMLRGVYYLPSGRYPVPRVARDLGLRSSGHAYVYFENNVTLVSSAEEVVRTTVTADIVMAGGGLVTMVGTPGVTVTVQENVVWSDVLGSGAGNVKVVHGNWSRYLSAPAATMSPFESYVHTVLRVAAPAGSFIVIPPGRDIEFFEQDVVNRVDRGNIRTADRFSFAPGTHLQTPPNSRLTVTYVRNIMVTVFDGSVSPAMTRMLEISLVVEEVHEGPALVDLYSDSNNVGMMLVDAEGYVEGAPFVALTDDAYFTEVGLDDDARDRIYTRIPKEAYLDLYGNMYLRRDRSIETALLPQRDYQFYRDNPMMYAVASECRRTGDDVPGSDCAEGDGQGLSFELPAGEEYVLTSPYDLEHAALLTAGYAGVDVQVEIFDVRGMSRCLTDAAAVLVNGINGEVMVAGGGACVPSSHESMVVETKGNDLQKELRVYTDTRLTVFGVDLSTVNYLAIDGALTLYAGGVVGGNYEFAAAQAMVEAGSEVFLGQDADLSHVTKGKAVFGVESWAAVVLGGVTVTINLADYVYSGEGGYTLSVTLGGDVLDVDAYGGVYQELLASSILEVTDTEAGADGFLDSSNNGFVELEPNQHIAMSVGYLWQGHVPWNSELRVFHRGSDASFYESYLGAYEARTVTSTTVLTGEGGAPGESGPARLTLEELSFPRGYLRLQVQSTVTRLNTWGSGLERPESIDRASQTYVQRPLAYDELNPDFSQDPYGNYGAGRHIARFERAYEVADWYLRSPAVTTTVLGAYDFAAAGSGRETLAVRGFAELMDGSRALSPDRGVDALAMVVAVRNLTTGAVQFTVARWRPVAVVNGMTVTGVIRINSGSASPFENSHTLAGAVSERWVEYFSQGDDGGTLIARSYQLPHEFMGRVNDSVNPEDGYIDGFSCDAGGAPIDRAVFNLPHVDLTGTGERFAAWPSERILSALPNQHAGRGVPLGGGYTVLAPARRSAYAPVSVFALSSYADLPIITAGGVSGTSTTLVYERQLTVGSFGTRADVDLVFYMDTNHHLSERNDVYVDGRRLLPNFDFGQARFGIHGPAAIVPPFAGQTERGTRQVYAERAQLVDAVFHHLPDFHSIYDEATGDCLGTGDCEAMYNQSGWFPYVGGALTFDEGVYVTFESFDDIRVIFPQPMAVVNDEFGNPVTLYAGSMLYPHNQLVQPATPIPDGEYVLESYGGIVGHVDVSPAHKQVNYETRTRLPQQFDGGVFNYPAVPSEGNPDCIVEPIGFAGPGPHFDFDLRAVKRGGDSPVWFETLASLTMSYMGAGNVVTATAQYSAETTVTAPVLSPVCQALGADASGYMGCYADTLGGDVRDSANPYWFEFGVRNRESIDRTQDWYHWQEATVAVSLSVAFAGNLNPAPVGQSRRSYTYEPIGVDTSFNRGVIANDAGRDLLIAYHSGSLFFNNTLRYKSYAVRDGATVTIFAADDLPTRNTDVPLGGPGAYWWQVPGTHQIPLGVAGISGTVYTVVNAATVGVEIRTDGDEFEALRLGHVVEILAGVQVTVRGWTGGHKYPSDEDAFFTFPHGATAIVLNNDLGSWLSANPYIGLYQQGMVVSVIGGAAMTVTANNDSYRRVDLSGRHVVHYARSMPSQLQPAYSNVPLHTNVWLRLPEGGRLVNPTTGDVIDLPDGSIVNPVMGTYLPGLGRVGSDVSGEARVEFNARGTALSDLHLTRPVLTVPAGARVVAQGRGGIIRNVKAAVFFSLAPIQSVSCPIGAIDTMAFVNGSGQSGVPVEINQLREGILDSAYATATGGGRFGDGHPCGWLDDEENMDGDRLFIYRGRRRYANDTYRLTVSSNDRTYLLGGRLEFNY